MAFFYPSISLDTASEPFELQVARGLIQGHTSLNISGYQAAVGASFIPIWENATPYVFPTAAQQMLLSSSSSADTAVLVRINGLDAGYNLLSEDLLLTNGTAGVTTVNSYFRVNGIVVVGSVNPAGSLSLTKLDKSVTYAKTYVGEGRSSMTVYTVPAGHTFFLAKVNCYADQSNNQITNYRSYTVNSLGIVTTILQAPFTGNYESTKTIPRGYSEKTDCQWQCNSSQISQVGLQIEGILIKGTNRPEPGVPRI